MLDGVLPTGAENAPTAWLWPDNVAAWGHWCNLQTQWRHAAHGMGGSVPSGLCYAGVIAYLQAHGHSTKRRGQRNLARMLQLIQACEAGSLEGIATKLANSPSPSR